MNYIFIVYVSWVFTYMDYQRKKL